MGEYIQIKSSPCVVVVVIDSDLGRFAGESVAKYIREPSPFNTQIVSLGVDTYLKMLLADNFVHTDLHPGNIMVRIRGVSHPHQAWPEIFLLSFWRQPLLVTTVVIQVIHSAGHCSIVFLTAPLVEPEILPFFFLVPATGSHRCCH